MFNAPEMPAVDSPEAAQGPAASVPSTSAAEVEGHDLVIEPDTAPVCGVSQFLSYFKNLTQIILLITFCM